MDKAKLRLESMAIILSSISEDGKATFGPSDELFVVIKFKFVVMQVFCHPANKMKISHKLIYFYFLPLNMCLHVDLAIL